MRISFFALGYKELGLYTFLISRCHFRKIYIYIYVHSIYKLEIFVSCADSVLGYYVVKVLGEAGLEGANRLVVCRAD